MGNLVSFFSARKGGKLPQKSNASSNVLQPVFFKYCLEQEQLPPEIDGYKNAIDLIIDLAAINRLSGDKDRAIAAAKALSCFLFESLGNYFSEEDELFYISEIYYDVFQELLQKNNCLFSNLFLSREKTKIAIAALFTIIPEQTCLSIPCHPPPTHTSRYVSE